MKTDIHPQYVDATVVCACGNTFQTRSTRTSIRTDLCNVCHPFYTGEQRIVDTAGQVERFMKRMQTAETNARPSKRQVRMTTRQEKEAADRRRAEEAAAAAAEARAERRRAQMEHEAALAAQQAAAADALAGETDAMRTPVSTETDAEHPVAAGAE